ncbi:ATP-binding cassette domain-containing protein [Tomitella fengzijianii]|uniref:ATP-binding cassette domain-containing protein n=1 Tax=Tomitella fengzijianii TaxID=2597660 RepID=A0A516X1I3_9ACTN|nr:ATP-binding cassette domain-containing protein [Tomitella fengzijianii]QDQ96471.1 ATP-binding cassette domain-containing protein [Tomitella fengzijianii]
MIEAHALTRTFGTRRRAATPLAGVSHVFADRTLTYVLGLNGTGKSTLLRCLSGVLRPDSGRALVDGRELARAPAPARLLGMYLDADGFHPGHSGRRHLRWLAAQSGVRAVSVEALLRRTGLEAVADRPVRGYSLGMRQRLGIASALVGNPRNVILDEPMNGLDVAGVLWLRGLLREWADEGRCVIVASHNLAEIEATADAVLILEGGGIVAHGTVDEVRGPHADLEQAFIARVPRAAGAPRVREAA